jgi:hypothetical protein
MIKSNSQRVSRKREIDLQGPEGNAFCIIGIAQDLMRQLNYSTEDRNDVMDDLKRSDYKNLIKVFDNEFGTLVDLQR